MGKLILRRLLTLIPVLLGLTTIIFALLYILPGDVARMMAGPSADPKVIENIRREMGLDRPLLVQYLDYLGNILQGDLGRSYQSNRPILSELAVVVPKTLQLAIAAEALSALVGIFLGMAAAAQQNKFIDRLITLMAAFQLSFPMFWLALMLQILLAVKLKWLPPSGYGNGFDIYIILPAITLAIPSSGILARLTRTALIELSSEDFIRTARSKGVRENTIILRHMLPNAMIPVVTTIGLDFTRLLGGVVIAEVIYGWPGLGKYSYDALVFKDMPALQGSVIVFAVLVMLTNLLVDLAYGWLDPRVRYA